MGDVRYVVLNKTLRGIELMVSCNDEGGQRFIDFRPCIEILYDFIPGFLRGEGLISSKRHCASVFYSRVFEEVVMEAYVEYFCKRREEVSVKS